MAESRRPKFSRVKQSWRPALSLQDRDIEFLRAAEEFRLLSTPQFLQLFPAESQAAIYRRLRTLFDHGYLDRIKGDPSAPMVYALGTRGAELLVERGFLRDVSDLSKKNREIQNRYVAHQEMIANFRIALVLATRDRSDLELSFFQREGVELHDRVTAVVDGRTHKIPVYPDGYFSLRFPLRPEGKNRAHFFLEADRSTMTLARLELKLAGYWHWYRQGGHTQKHGIRIFRVLTVTRSEERMQNLLKVAKEVDDRKAGSPMFCFTSETRYGPERPGLVFEPIWETPDRPGEPGSILPADVPAALAEQDRGTEPPSGP